LKGKNFKLIISVTDFIIGRRPPPFLERHIVKYCPEDIPKHSFPDAEVWMKMRKF
jgi:hypothetical protein